jgi:hypothetical protein
MRATCRCQQMSKIKNDGFMNVEELMAAVDREYAKLAAAQKAFVKNLNHLLGLKALDLETAANPLPGRGFHSKYSVTPRLNWPMEITETSFYEQINKMPQAKTRLVGWWR